MEVVVAVQEMMMMEVAVVTVAAEGNRVEVVPVPGRS